MRRDRGMGIEVGEKPGNVLYVCRVGRILDNGDVVAFPDSVAGMGVLEVDFSGRTCNEFHGGSIGIDGDLPADHIRVFNHPAKSDNQGGKDEHGNGNVFAKAGRHPVDNVADFFVATGSCFFFFHDTAGVKLSVGYWL